jgi:exonuclease VII large subunit
MVAAPREELLKRVLEAGRIVRETTLGRLEKIHMLMDQFSPGNLERNLRFLVQPTMQRFDDARELLAGATRDRLVDARHRLELAASALRAHSPLDVLKRGFAVVTRVATGEIVRSSEQTAVGDELAVRLHRGGLVSEVKRIETARERKESRTDEEL